MRLISTKEVSKILGVHIDTFRKTIKHQPNFPKPVLFHQRSRPRWRDIDIDRYLEEIAA